MQGGLLKVGPCIARQGREKKHLACLNNAASQKGFAIDPICKGGVIAADFATLDGANTVYWKRSSVRGISECSIPTLPILNDKILVAGGLPDSAP